MEFTVYQKIFAIFLLPFFDLNFAEFLLDFLPISSWRDFVERFALPPYVALRTSGGPPNYNETSNDPPLLCRGLLHVRTRVCGPSSDERFLLTVSERRGGESRTSLQHGVRGGPGTDRWRTSGERGLPAAAGRDPTDVGRSETGHR